MYRSRCLSGQAEHALGHDAALHLTRAAPNGHRAAVEARVLQRGEVSDLWREVRVTGVERATERDVGPEDLVERLEQVLHRLRPLQLGHRRLEPQVTALLDLRQHMEGVV